MTSAGAADAVVEPNHHAHHPGFSGVSGLMAAVKFLSGRTRAAILAIDRIELSAGDRLLDIGSGPGVAASEADRAGAQVVAVDPSPVMLGVGRARFVRSGIDWRPGTAESLPVTDGWANAIWSLATVHHWVDLDAGLDETWRALAPGGRFLAMERRIADPYAEGTASHGWTRQQAATFAECCRAVGFVDVTTAEHAGTPPLISVLAHRPAAP